MPDISSSNVQGIQQNFTTLAKLSDTSTIVSSVTSGITAATSDPIGVVLSATMTQVNKLSAVISNKIPILEADLLKMIGNTGKVQLVGTVLIITLSSSDKAKIASQEAAITNDINSLKSTINLLSTTVKSLNIISSTVNTLQTAMDVQQVALSASSPVTAATMQVIKKAMKIFNYQDVLKEYENILSRQLAQSEQVIADFVNRFSNLTVQFQVGTDANNGIVTTPTQAQQNIANQNLSQGSGTGPLAVSPQDYTVGVKTYILTVVAFGTNGELIGRATDSYSGQVVAETSPSFISTPQQLIDELKTILNQ